MIFREPLRVHFIGIGGAGMSAIAKVLLERGFQVAGSDLKASRASTILEAMGATVHLGHDPALVDGADVVVVSAAISKQNPEYVAATEKGIPVMTRGTALAALLEESRSIVVSGTHGKTTTTSMIVTILNYAGVDATYLVGAGLNDVGTNARSGTSDIAVAESDESDGSFLLLAPNVAVVTNVELDHVDRWGSLEELRDAFKGFLSKATRCAVVPAEDAHLVEAARGSDLGTIRFGTGGEVDASDVTLEGTSTSFVLTYQNERAEVTLRVPGAHNVSNALAAAGACLAVGVPLSQIATGLAAYRGVERRFQIRGEASGVVVIDDYAHHPTEVKATLSAAAPGPWRRVVAVFQPHRYSRTAALARDFGRSFDGADRVVLMDVYGAGEEAVPGVTGKLLADAVTEALPGRPVAYFPHRAELLGYLERLLRPGDALVTMGAGDVTTVGDELLARLGATS